ncbi:MAG: hypothetical protein IJD57_01590 [Candidatus Gastranaerophilales bacterium]|nr:hypothetical protein [Candidatus Gastranaerophilales bacterium]
MEISTQKGYGLTQNGNQYKKCKTAKIAGAVTGTAAAVAVGLQGINSLKKGQLPKSMRNIDVIHTTAILASIWGAIGTGAGAIIDHFINNNRKQEADGAAIQKQKLNTQV